MALLGISTALFAFGAATFYRIFRKAGRPGWLALVPVYNAWLLLDICGQSGWLLFVPVVNVAVLMIGVPFWLSRRFGKSELFAWGLVVAALVFYPILAFGRAKYEPLRPATF